MLILLYSLTSMLWILLIKWFIGYPPEPEIGCKLSLISYLILLLFFSLLTTFFGFYLKIDPFAVFLLYFIIQGISLCIILTLFCTLSLDYNLAFAFLYSSSRSKKLPSDLRFIKFSVLILFLIILIITSKYIIN